MAIQQAELAEFEQQADHWFAENKPTSPGFLLPDRKQLDFDFISSQLDFARPEPGVTKDFIQSARTCRNF